MSLIHEALKKVERQRQVGTAPTLDSPQYRRRNRPRRWPWLLLLVLILLLAGAWVWRGPLLHKARTVASLLAGHNEQGVEHKPSANAPTPNPSSGSASPGKNAASRQAVAANANASAGAPDRTAAKAAPVVKTQDKPEPQPAAKAAPVAAPQPARPAPAPIADKSTSVTAAAEKPGARTPVKTPAAVGQLAKKGPPMYWELPYDERRDIPEISISMHMYTDNPSDRFVIINGERQVEGDTLPSGLKLISVNPDSITLDKDGQEFRVPRQGSH